MKVRLSSHARAYIRQEASYLRDRNQKATTAFFDRMPEARRNLARFLGLAWTANGCLLQVRADWRYRQQPIAPEIEDDFDYEDPDTLSAPSDSKRQLSSRG